VYIESMRARDSGLCFAVLSSALVLSACGGARERDAAAPVPRDPRWAVPLAREGLPNLAQIEPDLFRGAQPEPAGFLALRGMGVRTIVNLRTASPDLDGMHESGLADDAFDYVEIPMLASRPDIEKARAFLAVAADPTRRPLFFHCKHGADRTGAMAAAYRVVVQGWSAQDAIAELVGGGFGYHPVFRGLPEFVRGLDRITAAPR
jgi:hypothetical protein